MRGWIASPLRPLLVLVVLACPAALAAPHEARVPLFVGSPQHVLGSRLVSAMNESLGEGCRLSVVDGRLVVHVDPARLPGDCETISKAVRVFTACASPRATAAQAAFYGLHLPERLDEGRPLVVLVHGLDCDRVNWGGMTQCLGGAGYQVAYFTYASDQPIAESAAYFGRNMRELRVAFPRLAVKVLAYSMGGLVARGYIEGPDYAGGVERLIMVGTPNTGSGWARMRMVLELQEHYHLWRDEPNWHWTWMITDGLGEAGRDLRPGSTFLKQLNSRPRREGVKYTIICGDQSPTQRITADWLDRTAGCVPDRVSNWWGFRQVQHGLMKEANKVRNKASAGDGPVKVQRAMLKGVHDVVIEHADHIRLYIGTDTDPPAAWDTIRDRLER